MVILVLTIIPKTLLISQEIVKLQHLPKQMPKEFKNTSDEEKWRILYEEREANIKKDQHITDLLKTQHWYKNGFSFHVSPSIYYNDKVNCDIYTDFMWRHYFEATNGRFFVDLGAGVDVFNNFTFHPTGGNIILGLGFNLE